MKRVLWMQMTEEGFFDRLTGNVTVPMCDEDDRQQCEKRKGQKQAVPPCFNTCRRVVVEITEKK